LDSFLLVYLPISNTSLSIYTITFGVCMDDIDKLRLRIQLAKRWMFESSELSIFSLTHFPTIIGTHTFSLSHFPDTVIGTHTFSLSHFPKNIVHAHILTFPLSLLHWPRTHWPRTHSHFPTFPTAISTHTSSLSYFPTVIATHIFSLSHFPDNIVHAHILTFLLSRQ